MVPLQPNPVLKYPPLVKEMTEALRTLLFPQLPDCPGRDALLASLLGTGISEAMYLLTELQGALTDDGDVCEFGVAQGATSALLANEIRASGKTLWLYDSFAGLPKPSPQDQLKDDIFQLGEMARYEGQMRCEPQEVQVRLDQIGYSSDKYKLVPGLVESSLLEPHGPERVCFAYVDFDFYSPIRHTLEYLDRHLSPHGRIVVDDYDFFSTGAKTAVDEFVSARCGRYTLVHPAPFAGKFCMLRRRS